MMRRKGIVATLLIALLLFGQMGLYANTVAPRPVNITFNGVPLRFDGIQPEVINGEVMMPLRAFEQLGFTGIGHFSTHHENGIFWHNEGEIFIGTDEFEIAFLTIDYMTLVARERISIVSVDYQGWMSREDNIAFHGDSLTWEVPEDVQFGFFGRQFDAGVAPVMRTNARPTPNLTPDARGFVEIPAIPANDMLLPLRPIASAAGFRVSWNGQTMALTRSATPELEQNTDMTTLFELAHHLESMNWGDGITFSLFWNADARRMELRPRNAMLAHAMRSDDISVSFNGRNINVGPAPPQLIGGEVFVSVDVFDQLGFEVNQWSGWHVDHEWLGGDNSREIPGSGRMIATANLTIDYMNIHLSTDTQWGSSVGYFAWVSPQTWRNIHAMWGTPEEHLYMPSTYTQMHVYGEMLTLNNQPQLVDVAWTAPRLTFGADGFAQIPPRANQAFMVPLRPIAQVVGFRVEWDGRTMTLTRSANPETEHDNSMLSPFELANHTEFRLFWNSAERRLEIRH